MDPLAVPLRPVGWVPLEPCRPVVAHRLLLVVECRPVVEWVVECLLGAECPVCQEPVAVRLLRS